MHYALAARSKATEVIFGQRVRRLRPGACKLGAGVPLIAKLAREAGTTATIDEADLGKCGTHIDWAACDFHLTNNTSALQGAERLLDRALDLASTGMGVALYPEPGGGGRGGSANKRSLHEVEEFKDGKMVKTKVMIRQPGHHGGILYHLHQNAAAGLAARFLTTSRSTLRSRGLSVESFAPNCEADEACERGVAQELEAGRSLAVFSLIKGKEERSGTELGEQEEDEDYGDEDVEDSGLPSVKVSPARSSQRYVHDHSATPVSRERMHQRAAELTRRHYHLLPDHVARVVGPRQPHTVDIDPSDRVASLFDRRPAASAVHPDTSAAANVRRLVPDRRPKKRARPDGGEEDDINSAEYLTAAEQIDALFDYLVLAMTRDTDRMNGYPDEMVVVTFLERIGRTRRFVVVYSTVGEIWAKVEAHVKKNLTKYFATKNGAKILARSPELAAAFASFKSLPSAQKYDSIRIRIGATIATGVEMDYTDVEGRPTESKFGSTGTLYVCIILFNDLPTLHSVLTAIGLVFEHGMMGFYRSIISMTLPYGLVDDLTTSKPDVARFITYVRRAKGSEELLQSTIDGFYSSFYPDMPVDQRPSLAPAALHDPQRGPFRLLVDSETIPRSGTRSVQRPAGDTSTLLPTSKFEPCTDPATDIGTSVPGTTRALPPNVSGWSEHHWRLRGNDEGFEKLRWYAEALEKAVDWDEVRKLAWARGREAKEDLVDRWDEQRSLGTKEDEEDEEEDEEASSSDGDGDGGAEDASTSASTGESSIKPSNHYVDDGNGGWIHARTAQSTKRFDEGVEILVAMFARSRLLSQHHLSPLTADMLIDAGRRLDSAPTKASAGIPILAAVLQELGFAIDELLIPDLLDSKVTHRSSISLAAADHSGLQQLLLSYSALETLFRSIPVRTSRLFARQAVTAIFETVGVEPEGAIRSRLNTLIKAGAEQSSLFCEPLLDCMLTGYTPNAGVQPTLPLSNAEVLTRLTGEGKWTVDGVARGDIAAACSTAANLVTLASKDAIGQLKKSAEAIGLDTSLVERGTTRRLGAVGKWESEAVEVALEENGLRGARARSSATLTGVVYVAQLLGATKEQWAMKDGSAEGGGVGKKKKLQKGMTEEQIRAKGNAKNREEQERRETLLDFIVGQLRSSEGWTEEDVERVLGWDVILPPRP